MSKVIAYQCDDCGTTTPVEKANGWATVTEIMEPSISRDLCPTCICGHNDANKPQIELPDNTVGLGCEPTRPVGV